MKRLILLIFSFCFALPIVAPRAMTRSAYAQKSATRAQRNAAYQWASVIRRCKTAPVMWQVVDLMNDVIDKVAAKGDLANNTIFLGSLRQMRAAARLKAQGLESNNKGLIRVAEQTILMALKLVNG